MTVTTPLDRFADGDHPPLRELATGGVLASWAYLYNAARRPSAITGALAGYSLPVLAAIVWFRLWWLLLAFPVLFAVCVAAMFAVFTASARRRHRILLMHRSPAGRAGLVLRTRSGPDGPYWLLENMWARPRGDRVADRTRRPGATLLHRAIALADAHTVPLHLVSADQALAVKVYLPAGFGYADDRQRTRRRPRMVRPPATR